MFTFLRKIRRSLVGSGNVGKYLIYAIGEITLVVIGILIALQINNWNEWRKNQHSQEILLQGLKNEFFRNQQLFERGLDLRSRWIANCDSLIWISQMKKADRGNFVLWNIAQKCFREFTFDPMMGQYDALVNAGRLELIENDSLRLILTNWPFVVNDLKEDEFVSREFALTTVNEFLPNHIDLQDNRQAGMLEILSDYRFKSRISRQKDWHLISNNQGKETQQTLRRIIRLLELETQ
jgi:hypothetical protein